MKKKMQKRIMVFTGSRAEYGLLFWLMKDISMDAELELKLLVSGMHLSPEFGETYKYIEDDGFVIDEKIEILLSSDSSAGVLKSMGLGLISYADSLSRLKPDIVIILGDRFEALSFAQSASIMNIPILHLHGGEISEGSIDDSIRHAITKLSHCHGTSTVDYKKRVIQLGENPKNVFNVGAVGLDHIKRTRLKTRLKLSKELNFDLSCPYIVVTYHPVTVGDEDPEKTLKNILKVLDNFKGYNVIFTYPNADEGGRKIISLIKAFCAASKQTAIAVPSLGHEVYLSSLKHCAAIIGNSSSGIIESASLYTPTVNIGIRQKGRIYPDNVINCNTDQKSIDKALRTALSEEFKKKCKVVKNPYGSGNSSKKIIKILKNMSKDTLKKFYNIK